MRKLNVKRRPIKPMECVFSIAKKRGACPKISVNDNLLGRHRFFASFWDWVPQLQIELLLHTIESTTHDPTHTQKRSIFKSLMIRLSKIGSSFAN